MAKLAPEDPYCGLPDDNLLSQSGGADLLDVWDDSETNPVLLKSRAHELEAAALSVPGVIQAEGANASWSTSAFCYATSHGFRDGWRASRHGLSVSAIAEQGGAMERDSGPAITRGVSFLKGDLGQAIFSKDIQILEDPLLPRGDGSRPWDGEALPVQNHQCTKLALRRFDPCWILAASCPKKTSR